METVVHDTELLAEEVIRITEEQEKSFLPLLHHSNVLLLLDQFIVSKDQVTVFSDAKQLELYRCAIVNLVNNAVNNFYLNKERLSRNLEIKYSLFLDIDAEPTNVTCSTISFDDYNLILMYRKNQAEFRERLETIYTYLNNLCVKEEEKEKKKEKETEDKISDCICS